MLAVILLTLIQPIASTVGGLGTDERCDNIISESEYADASSTLTDRCLSTQLLDSTKTSGYFPSLGNNIHPALPHPEFLAGGRLLPPDTGHRGILDLNMISPLQPAQRGSSGPNTPPPVNGDWIIDQPGNVVNNAIIPLNGNLNITTGDLTLDRVSLIMNCIVDGQYGININPGGMLKITNSIITASDGSSHYNFTVYGTLTMDGCNVSETWGDMDKWQDPAGIVIYSDTVTIQNSIIAQGKGSGIQVRNFAAPTITDNMITENLGDGLYICDNASGIISNNSVVKNSFGGFDIVGWAHPFINSCNIEENGLGSGMSISKYQQMYFQE
jgi:parallel beta-helix repeat protein